MIWNTEFAIRGYIDFVRLGGTMGELCSIVQMYGTCSRMNLPRVSSFEHHVTRWLLLYYIFTQSRQ